MAESGRRIASEGSKVGAESSDFPIICETCLGDDPYVRMMKETLGLACKMCERPTTLFRWKAGKNGRFKQTIVCQHCSRMKNICQTCLLDLEFGVPVQVRDRFLAENDRVSVPTSTVGRLYQAEYNDTLALPGQQLPYGKLSDLPEVKKLLRSTPYYKRNETKICSFFVRGACNRGELCPFRHEMPEKSEISTQSISERFHGKEDPVAAKILARLGNKPK